MIDLIDLRPTLSNIVENCNKFNLQTPK